MAGTHLWPRRMSTVSTILYTSFHGTYTACFNWLAPGKSQCDFKNVIFNLPLLIGIFKSFYDNVLRWMPQDLTDDKATLVQVMAWYRQATSNYPNQCWPRSPAPYGVTKPQWVKNITIIFIPRSHIAHLRKWYKCPHASNRSLWSASVAATVYIISINDNIILRLYQKYNPN